MAGTGQAHLRDSDCVLLRVEDLVVEYRHGSRRVHAVSGISFDVERGETLGLVGESGCGKSSAARAVLQVPKPTAGSVTLDGVELTRLKRHEMRRFRHRLQMIFQDPVSSLNPRRKVRDIVAEGLVIRGGSSAEDIDTRVRTALEAVGLDPDAGDRRPHEFSGGQCQRVCIARALLLDPDVIVCDEPVSSLDVSVQAQILNLLEDMKIRYGLTLVFIAHDLAVVKNVSDRIAVMYLGKLCEVAGADLLYAQPRHPYTHALLDAVPDPDAESDAQRAVLGGDLPSPLDPPGGCRFHPRCPSSDERCRAEEPVLRELAPQQFVACHHPMPAAVPMPA
jgi:peptide/nickel transport system ATP-binding protein